MFEQAVGNTMEQVQSYDLIDQAVPLSTNDGTFTGNQSFGMRSGARISILNRLIAAAFFRFFSFSPCTLNDTTHTPLPQ